MILVTGANGFVGSHVVDTLLNRGLDIKIVSRPSSLPKYEGWENVKEIILTNNLFTESDKWLCEVLSGVEIVIHGGCYAEPGKYLDSDLNLECVTGTIALAKAANKVGVKKFVGIGTCFEYAQSDMPLSVNSPLGPSMLYATSKTACYSILNKFFENKKTNFAWARLFYLFGDRENSSRLVPYLINRLSKGEIAELTSGEQIRDYMDVAKAAETIVDVSCGDQTGAINICSGEAISIRELAESIAKKYGAESCLQFGTRAPNLTDPKYVVGVPNY